ncbi:kelch-like protein 29 isoform X3 [Brachypodium distachyon]|uniref:kelch-like protein 29 isoform X3 n=1 Tax=Brachypodium distachyon TaxID=15368 RepID=UPI000D0CCF04|nr:kelch-like protein 29 isoform X3 [Brachypodium distachyon]|eukprot:XP_024315260.1 kelch-like protein 29 isoform X3 [Brachypodium distachyon]
MASSARARMGAGRKTETYNAATPSNTRLHGDQSFSAHNLKEDKLAGVIFGCTHKTINECLSKQLFGLPAGHFTYVKNIKPGLPLFLFNYSDRKMHGIFEAATSGQLAIDQFAWSHDGRTKTLYPAQFGVSSHSLDPVPYKLVDQNADNASASRTSKNNFDEEASDWDDLDDGLTEKGLDAVSDYRPHINAVHDEQHDTMAILQKLQELSLLRQEKAQSSKDVVSISDKSIPQESPPGATFPKDPSNVTLEGDPVVKDNTSFEQHCGNDELVQIINEIAKKTEAIGKKQIESDQEILVLRKYVKNMKTKLQQLQYQHDKLQMEYSAVLLGETRNIVEGPSIFLIGGHNGISWLPSLDSFYPTIDRLMPLRPMSSARSYTGVAALNDHIYVFGGGDGSSWYNTVECYNRVSNEWMACPRLKQKKGSLAGATLNGKIFAIGGGDGYQSLSEVEMFDPALGSWIYSPFMRQCRFTPAAAELNGVLYVVGGYDFNSNTYLQSMERYDPREGLWTQLASMTTKRGSHSVTVLGEALYAVGGHDGNHMVSTVEIFDPRANSWRLSSPISIPRGYACAVTANDNVYLIGGIETNGENIETVEMYNERQGWSIPGYKAIGQRSFASSIVV